MLDTIVAFPEGIVQGKIVQLARYLAKTMKIAGKFKLYKVIQ